MRPERELYGKCVETDCVGKDLKCKMSGLARDKSAEIVKRQSKGSVKMYGAFETKQMN